MTLIDKRKIINGYDNILTHLGIGPRSPRVPARDRPPITDCKFLQASEVLSIIEEAVSQRGTLDVRTNIVHLDLLTNGRIDAITEIPSSDTR